MTPGSDPRITREFVALRLPLVIVAMKTWISGSYEGHRSDDRWLSLLNVLMDPDEDLADWLPPDPDDPHAIPADAPDDFVTMFESAVEEEAGIDLYHLGLTEG